MIVSWLTYGLLVGLLVSLGAVAAERAARAQRWPTRWVWAGAMLLTAGLPLATWLSPAAPDPGPFPGLTGVYVLESLPALSAQTGGGGGTAVEDVVLLTWAVVTAGLLLWVAALALRLRAAGRRWPRRRVDGVDVLVSRSTGPAAMGVIRGRVVVPEWALALDARRRRLLVLHEAEHVRSGDPQLAAAGLIVCALAPWLLPLWWQLSRLRLAIEVDCDARVLSRDGDVGGYGSLLLEVGQRRASLAVALMESRSMLERRIRMIARMTTVRRTGRAVGLAGVAGVLLAVACETPGPTEVASPQASEPSLAAVQEEGAMGCEPLVYVNGEASTQAALSGLEPEGIASIEVFKGPAVRDLPGGGAAASAEGAGDPGCGVISVLTKDASAAEQARVRELAERLTAERTRQRQPQTLAQVEGGPTFTPMDERPSLRNADEIVEALKANYPPLLRDAGIGGTANVWMLIDADGTMQKMQINRSSGRDALDAAALRTAALMRFSPARLKGDPVPVWIALDIRFEATEGEGAVTPSRPRPDAEAVRRMREETAERERGQGVAPSPAEVAAGPTFTPMTERPQLSNQGEVREALTQHYPPLLRNAGIGGTANVWLFIDQTGRVQRMQVNRSSGHEALDQAALRVAGLMEFTPARNGDRVVPVWVALDITFETQ